MDTTKTITHLSLCSGYEGIGLGLRRVLPNLREIAYVEIEAFAIANLVAKMEAEQLDPAPIFTDLKTFPYEQFRGKVDILSGGFPCQPFSSAGKRKATDDPRHLFPFIADGIRKCQPRIVFLENVQGILSCKTGDGEPVLQYVLRELEEMGYQATAGIFSAEEVGAPHQRKRVFILGYAKGKCYGLNETKQKGGNTFSRSSQELANSQNFGRRGRSDRDGDNSRWVQEQETQEQPDLRSQVEGCGGDIRGEELGNTTSLRPREHREDSRETSQDQSREERRMYESKRTSALSKYGSQSQNSSELANTCSKGSQGSKLSQALHREAKAQYSTSQCSNDERLGQTPELANSESEGLEGHSGLRSKQDRGCELTSQGLWPSRPSQAQYEWEEPRVVANSESRGTGRKSGDVTSKGQIWESTSKSSPKPIECKAKSKLGRATDGTTCRVDATTNRVDRLRLLGNGVVNQTAAKAFVTLIQRLT